jgi:hypothetical protein
MLKSAGFAIAAIAVCACKSPEAAPPPIVDASASATTEDAATTGLRSIDGGGLSFGGGGVSTVSITTDHPSVVGNVSADAVERIIRINYGRFRLCYEHALAKDATLAGRIEIKFTIGADGYAKSITHDGSTLADKDLMGCVDRNVALLSFDPPTSGIATITYPLIFAPH